MTRQATSAMATVVPANFTDMVVAVACFPAGRRLLLFELVVRAQHVWLVPDGVRRGGARPRAEITKAAGAHTLEFTIEGVYFYETPCKTTLRAAGCGLRAGELPGSREDAMARRGGRMRAVFRDRFGRHLRAGCS
jgi:hypothetical protein